MNAPIIEHGLIARSPAMTRVFRQIENLQTSEAPVLLTGERGTGKDAVARAIHEHSPRRNAPFIIIVGRSPLPNELQHAAQGTLFLEEVTELPRIPEPARARVSASTSASYHETEAFICIEVPPLRERREDIDPLVRVLLRRIGDRDGRYLRLAPDAIRVLLDYSWPANVEELEGAIEYAAAVTKGEIIEPEDLPREIAHHVVDASAKSIQSEPERLRAALESHRWRREETARALGMSRATLWRRMREYGLL